MPPTAVLVFSGKTRILSHMLLLTTPQNKEKLLPLSHCLPPPDFRIGQIPVSGSRRPIVVGKASEAVGHSLSWCIAVQSALKPENKG
ncbi:hypothetical protein MUG91_G35n100 [Manis pentadactyla]|nr:hypothetical protein MUG91_G35n100 [Manis pentadactyla]